LIPSEFVAGIVAGFNPQGSLTAVDMGDGKHFWQEDIPTKLAAEISSWYQRRSRSHSTGEFKIMEKYFRFSALDFRSRFN